jgi:hypothetical protein
LPLPTEKTKPTLGVENLKAVLYGQPKVGKSTFASQLDPDHTLFIATEPGLDGLSVYQTPCRDWGQFREIGADLATGDHDFKLVVVDTVDELQRMCGSYVIEGLAGNRTGFVHASDFEYGKGWEAITSEFRLRVAKLCTLGLGVVFISHAKEATKTDRVGREITTISADVGQKGSRQWLLGYVDYILYAAAEQIEDGDRRVLHTQASETYEAGGRGVPLPDPLPLDALAFRKALEDATAALRGEQPKQAEAKEPVAA